MWCISPIICLRVRVNAAWRGGGGGDEKRSSTHSHGVREAERECEKEKETRSARGWTGICVQGRDLFGLLLQSGVELGL